MVARLNDGRLPTVDAGDLTLKKDEVVHAKPSRACSRKWPSASIAADTVASASGSRRACVFTPVAFEATASSSDQRSRRRTPGR